MESQDKGNRLNRNGSELCLAAWRGYQADFNGHRTCRIGFGRGFLTALDRLIGETNCRLASLTGKRFLG